MAHIKNISIENHLDFAEYEHTRVGYIYVTRCIVNSKIYVGQHVGTFHDGYVGSGTYFHNAFNKYGGSAWAKTILEIVNPDMYFDNALFFSALDNAEIWWIAYLESMKHHGHGYNLTAGGGGLRGYTHTAKTRAKFGATIKALFSTPKYHDILCNSQKKRYEDPEQRAIVSQASKKMWANPVIRELIMIPKRAASERPEVRKRHSAASKKMHDNPDFQITCKWCGKTVPKTIHNGNHGNKCYLAPDEIREDKSRNLKDLICPYCGVSGSGPNMSRYHFDNCTKNPDHDKDKVKSNRTLRKLKCEWCGKFVDPGNYGASHGAKCKKAPVEIRVDKKPNKKTITTCPHCGKSGAASNMTRYHFEYCKKAPTEIRKYKDTRAKKHKTCEHCGNNVAVNIHAQFHGDKCKQKPSDC